MTRKLVFGLVIVWVGIFGFSLFSFFVTEKSGDGFTRGLDQIGALIIWQAGALALAIVAGVLLLTIKRPRGWITQITGFGPIVISGVLALVVILFVLSVGFSEPEAVPEVAPAQPTTQVPTN